MEAHDDWSLKYHKHMSDTKNRTSYKDDRIEANKPVKCRIQDYLECFMSEAKTLPSNAHLENPIFICRWSVNLG